MSPNTFGVVSQVSGASQALTTHNHSLKRELRLPAHSSLVVAVAVALLCKKKLRLTGIMCHSTINEDGTQSNY